MKYKMFALIAFIAFLLSLSPSTQTTRIITESLIIIDGKRLVCCVCGCKQVCHVLTKNNVVYAYCDRCVKTRA
jgi:late competence protein required for DNA uptake (superfamily II DNA/RNA helicase)